MIEFKKNVRNDIEKLLKNKKFVNQFGINLAVIDEFIASKKLTYSIQNILEELDFSPKRVFEMIEPLIHTITKNKPDNWMEYFYQYTLKKSFPRATEIEFDLEFDKVAEIYLRVLRIITNYQKKSNDGTWQSKFPIDLMTKKETEELENNKEYIKFEKNFREDYVYEMMVLNKEVIGYTTIDHICGVHAIAMKIARQLKYLGFPLDLGRVAGAAAGHDVGKFGCVGDEGKRVAYYHYYYTGEWFSERDIVYIRNVAINHSTWDLELDALPIESLILIYSDFRVKNAKINGKYEMSIFSLQDSFQVILDMLDNVDKEKENRYKRVYDKLEDFEKFMLDMGVNVDPSSNKMLTPNDSLKRKYFSLMQGNEITENVIYSSISHNINLLYRLRDEESLNKLLEPVRSTRDTSELRGYISILEDYYYYLTQKQKLILINFLYSKLTLNEEDIREQCASLIGRIIASFDEEIRKEIPPSAEVKVNLMTTVKLYEYYIEKFLKPPTKIIDRHKTIISYALRDMLYSYFIYLEEEEKRKKSIESIARIFAKYQKDKKIKFYLVKIARVLPLEEFKSDEMFIIVKFISMLLTSRDQKLKLRAYNIIYSIIPFIDEEILYDSKIMRVVYKNPKAKPDPAENYAMLKLVEALKIDKVIVDKYKDICLEDLEYDSEIFLSNLKSVTYDVAKKFQIELLMRNTILYDYDRTFYMAMHLCNLLKVSALETVRNAAGRSLIDIMPHLTFSQKNDIVIELLKSLEMESYQFTKYIPPYFGRLILHLKPKELDEVIDEFEIKMRTQNPRIITLIEMTVGVAVQNYSKYRYAFKERDEIHDKRIERLFGLLFSGMVVSSKEANQTSFKVIAKEVFASKHLTLNQKKFLYNMSIKKIMTLLVNTDESIDLLFFNNSSGLNKISNFISDYRYELGELNIVPNKKIAFFPGAFDPFTLSHWVIANDMKEKGFEVLLYVDEFSWSKMTQPNLIRRNIVKKSVANVSNIYSFPRDISINIANEGDLTKLKNLFPRSQVFLVVGSDVVLNASAYRKEEKSVINSIPHIIYDRLSEKDINKNIALEHKIENLHEDTVRFKLPKEYEHISSTMIRNYIDEKRDISSLISPLAQNFIYDKGLYQREPELKNTMNIKSIKVEVFEFLSDSVKREILSSISENKSQVEKQLVEASRKLNFRITLLRNGVGKNEIFGFSICHWVRAIDIHKEFEASDITKKIRQESIGRILLIDTVKELITGVFKNVEAILFTETIAMSLSKDYTFCIYKENIERHISKKKEEILYNQGFVSCLSERADEGVFYVDMSRPCILNQDIESMFKEPYRSHKDIVKVMENTRKKLQKAIAMLYPGSLVLSIDRLMVYENLIKKICKENKMPDIPIVPKTTGENMCVPFGNILKTWIIPNTVTKTIHCEKYFHTNYKELEILEYPYYLDIDNQVKIIKSFNRPVILVDDLLNKGYRIKALEPNLKKNEIPIAKMIVGIMSGNGKEIAEKMNIDVDSAYFIPNIKVWFYESKMYPFLGGDAVWRGSIPDKNLINSANLIYPYTSASYIKDVSSEKIFNLSKVVFENAIEIMNVVEKKYEKYNERLLTIERLGEVLYSPRFPDKGNNIEYSNNIRTTDYIKGDLEHLNRLESVYVK